MRSEHNINELKENLKKHQNLLFILRKQIKIQEKYIKNIVYYIDAYNKATCLKTIKNKTIQDFVERDKKLLINFLKENKNKNIITKDIVDYFNNLKLEHVRWKYDLTSANFLGSFNIIFKNTPEIKIERKTIGNKILNVYFYN